MSSYVFVTPPNSINTMLPTQESNHNSVVSAQMGEA